MKVISFLKEIYRRILADSEEDSDQGGYLSWRGEWHSALWGLGVGVIAAATGNWWILIAGVGWMFTRAGDRKIPEYIPYPKQFLKESGYVVGHALAGILIGTGIRVLTIVLEGYLPSLI